MIDQSSFQQIQYISFTERIKIITIKYLIIFSLYLFTTSLQFYLYIFFYFYVIFFLLNLLLFLAFYVFESVNLKKKKYLNSILKLSFYIYCFINN